MSFGLENRNAVVTGAARGIGLAIARRFAELGADVSGWDIDCNPIVDDPAFVHLAEVDVTCEAAAGQAFQSTRDAFPHVDIVVANAGINGPTKPTQEYSAAEWRRVIDVNLTGVFLTTRPFIEQMRRRDWGRIIIVASVAGKEGNPGACAYGAAKAGVIGYAKGLARELLPSGITVNCLAPAIAETGLLKEMSADYIADRTSRIPMGRLCSLKEISDMASWIASPGCSFTTGQVFDLSGGRADY